MRWNATPLPKTASVAGTDASEDTMYSCTDRMDSDCWDLRAPSRSPSFIDLVPLSLTHLPDDALHHILSYLPVSDKYEVVMSAGEWSSHPDPSQAAKLPARVQAPACRAANAIPCMAHH